MRDDDLAADAAFFGLDAAEWQAPAAAAEVEVWEEHLPAWTAWCAVATQWRTTALSTLEGVRIVWHGLDYTAARAGFELAGIGMTAELWDEVRAIEAGAVKEFERGR